MPRRLNGVCISLKGQDKVGFKDDFKTDSNQLPLPGCSSSLAGMTLASSKQTRRSMYLLFPDSQSYSNTLHWKKQAAGGEKKEKSFAESHPQDQS